MFSGDSDAVLRQQLRKNPAVSFHDMALDVRRRRSQT